MNHLSDENLMELVAEGNEIAFGSAGGQVQQRSLQTYLQKGKSR